MDLGERVVGFSSDDSEAFAGAARATFPKAVRSLDFYHVMERHKANVNAENKLRGLVSPTLEKTDAQFAETCAWNTERLIKWTRHVHNPWLFHLVWKFAIEKMDEIWGAPLCARYHIDERLVVRKNVRPPDNNPRLRAGDGVPDSARPLMTLDAPTKHGRREAILGQISADWHSSLERCPPNGAAGTAAIERNQREVKKRFLRNDGLGAVVAQLEHHLYPASHDYTVDNPRPSTFPQAWNDDLLRKKEPRRTREEQRSFLGNEDEAEGPEAREYCDARVMAAAD